MLFRANYVLSVSRVDGRPAIAKLCHHRVEGPKFFFGDACTQDCPTCRRGLVRGDPPPFGRSIGRCLHHTGAIGSRSSSLRGTARNSGWPQRRHPIAALRARACCLHPKRPPLSVYILHFLPSSPFLSVFYNQHIWTPCDRSDRTESNAPQRPNCERAQVPDPAEAFGGPLSSWSMRTAGLGMP